MTSPRGRLVWMAIGLVAVIGLVYLLWDQIYRAFLHNPALNAGIYVVELIGIVYIFWQVIRLYPEIAWIERFKRGELGGSNDPVPRLLAPMEAMVRERTGRLTLSAVALRSLLDSISARLDETRDISRYFIGLMVFLGLLGTFWGLLGTIGGVADAIGAISVSGGDIASLFGQLKSGLQGPLAGMGTAFSASLFGLACCSWAIWNCRRARPRTASSPSWRTGWPSARGLPVPGRSATANSRSRSISRRSSSRLPTIWKTCSGSWGAAKRAGCRPTPR